MRRLVGEPGAGNGGCVAAKCDMEGRLFGAERDGVFGAGVVLLSLGAQQLSFFFRNAAA